MPVSSAYIKCIANPWGEPAQIADEFSMPTSAVKVRSVHTLLSSDNGSGLLVLQPWDLFNVFVQQGTFTTGTSTVASYSQALHQDQASLTSYYNMYRSVSMGVKVFYTAAEQATAGVIGIVPLMSVNPSLTACPTDLSAWTQMPYAKTVAAAAMTEPLCGVCHSFDRPAFHGNTTQNDRFPSMAIVLLGAPINTNCLRIEVHLNIEVLPRLSTAFSGNNAQPAQHNEIAMSQSRRLTPARVGTEAQVTRLPPAVSSHPYSGSSSAHKRKSSGSSSHSKTSAPGKRANAPTGLLMVPSYRSKGVRKSKTTRRRLY